MPETPLAYRLSDIEIGNTPTRVIHLSRESWDVLEKKKGKQKSLREKLRSYDRR